MNPFFITESTIDTESLRKKTITAHSGAFCCFEGWVRNHHNGKSVVALEYTSYTTLAEKEGIRIMAEASDKFSLTHAICCHRIGPLKIGEIAVFVAVSAAHREPAFSACRFVIDEIKSRVPIWKKEQYSDGTFDWPNCQGCSHSHGTSL